MSRKFITPPIPIIINFINKINPYYYINKIKKYERLNIRVNLWYKNENIFEKLKCKNKKLINLLIYH